MACFVVPAAEAIVATVAAKAIKSKESAPVCGEKSEGGLKTAFVKRLNWLTNLLWGGSALLAFEHLWHGEIVPWFPFLTALDNPADKAAMLREMATVGVTMALTVTAVWAAAVVISHTIQKRATAQQPASGAAE